MVPAVHPGWAVLLLTVNSKYSGEKCKERKSIKWYFSYWQFRSCLSKDFVQTMILAATSITGNLWDLLIHLNGCFSFELFSDFYSISLFHLSPLIFTPFPLLEYCDEKSVDSPKKSLWCCEEQRNIHSLFMQRQWFLNKFWGDYQLEM